MKTNKSARTVIAAGLLMIGTAAAAAEITLFEHAEFAGTQLTLRAHTRDIAGTGLNDRTSSVVVTSGRWELCTEADFKGTCAIFTRGEYPVLQEGLNDRISSARETGSYGDRRGSYSDYGRGSIELFDEPGLRGGTLRLDADAPTLRGTGFNNRAASVNVSQGTWELCSDPEFGGTCRTYAPGRYADLGYGMTGQVSSARLLRSSSEAPAVVSPGLPPGPANLGGRAILFSERGLRGTSLAVSGAVPDLQRSNFNDTSESLYVESGTFVACRDSHFRGECRTFGPGRYDDLGAAGLERAISSIRPGAAAEPPATGRPGAQSGGNAGIEFFSEPDFRGERVQIDRPTLRDLERLNFNDRVASAIITGGTWEMCTDVGFAGSCSVFQPGRYPRLGAFTRQISSVRRIE